jgi:hypothetical protein
MKKFILAIAILMVIVSCSRIQKMELDENVKVFLTDFQKQLQGSDEDILKLFAGAQSKEEILKAIYILQNKDTLVKARILFDSAKSHREDSYLIVELPVDLISGDQQAHRSLFFFQLFKNDGQFRIGKLEGEKLYSDFFGLKNSIENAEELARRMADMKVYYDRARELKKDYDSIVWYVHHKNMTYYYAVKGNYNFDSLKKERPQGYKMGLIDETGKVIVPVEYDLIGNPSMTLSEAIEVKKEGKIGFYSLEGKLIIEPSYEWLVPYEKGFANALVKKDSAFGWLSKDYTFNKDFPSPEAERTINEFEYLTSNTFSLGKDYQDLIHIIYPLTGEFYKNMGFGNTGLVVPSAYLVKMGIFPQIEDGFITQIPDKGYVYGNDYSQMKSQKPFSITEILTGFVTEFQTRYIGGRGEFYNRREVVVVDEKRNILNRIWIGGGGFGLKKMNDTLFQYSFLPEYDEPGPGENFPEYNFPVYGYFKVEGKKLIVLETYRRFAFTEITKLDSSYLKGNFDFWDRVTQKQSKSTFLSREALFAMRNEILAGYGFIFTEPDQAEWFKYQQWYKPTTESYEEVYSKLSEIDKYNLDFLARILGPYQPKNPS